MNSLYFDESVSSWLCRQIVYGECSRKDINHIGLRSLLENKQKFGDIDFGYDDDDLGIVSTCVPFAPPDLIECGRFIDYWRIEDCQSRLSFCPNCIIESFGDLRAVAWQKTWARGWYVICHRHGVPLETLKGTRRSPGVEDRRRHALTITFERIKSNLPNDFFLHPRVEDHMLIMNLGREKASIGIELFKDQILKLAWISQCRISNILLSSREGYEKSSSELVVVLDLVKVLLRLHEHPFESAPYAFQLAGYVKGRAPYVHNAEKFGGVDELVRGAEQNEDSYIRLVALAIVARLMDYPGADNIWGGLVREGLRLGLLIPDSLGWLYAAAVGDPSSVFRNWHAHRVDSYPRPFGDKLGSLLAAPVDYSGIRKSIKTLSGL